MPDTSYTVGSTHKHCVLIQDLFFIFSQSFALTWAPVSDTDFPRGPPQQNFICGAKVNGRKWKRVGAMITGKRVCCYGSEAEDSDRSQTRSRSCWLQSSGIVGLISNKVLCMELIQRVWLSKKEGVLLWVSLFSLFLLIFCQPWSTFSTVIS